MENSSRSRRFFTGLLSGLAVISGALTLTEVFRFSVYGWDPIVLRLIPLLSIIIIAAFIISSLRWRRLHIWLEAFIRLWLAFELCVYGFAKIFHTQFTLPFHVRDMTVDSLTGFNLTWTYFGYSYVFAVIIAMVQIAGAVCLLFRRTILLGAVILLPMMVNIVLINIFYEIAGGAFLNSILFTTALIYLITPQLVRLLRVLFQTTQSDLLLILPVKTVLRIAIIALPFFVVYRLSPDQSSDIAGKWKVERLVREHNDTIARAEIFNWKNIYIEDSGDIGFCANPYLYDENLTIWGRYRYHREQRQLHILFGPGYSEPDSILVNIKSINSQQMEWTFEFQKHPIVLHVTK